MAGDADIIAASRFGVVDWSSIGSPCKDMRGCGLRMCLDPDCFDGIDAAQRHPADLVHYKLPDRIEPFEIGIAPLDAGNAQRQDAQQRSDRDGVWIDRVRRVLRHFSFPFRNQ